MTRADVMEVLELWLPWAEKVEKALGEKWKADDTAVTWKLTCLFQEGKTPEEATTEIRQWSDDD